MLDLKGIERRYISTERLISVKSEVWHICTDLYSLILSGWGEHPQMKHAFWRWLIMVLRDWFPVQWNQHSSFTEKPLKLMFLTDINFNGIIRYIQKMFSKRIFFFSYWTWNVSNSVTCFILGWVVWEFKSSLLFCFVLFFVGFFRILWWRRI